MRDGAINLLGDEPQVVLDLGLGARLLFQHIEGIARVVSDPSKGLVELVRNGRRHLSQLRQPRGVLQLLFLASGEISEGAPLLLRLSPGAHVDDAEELGLAPPRRRRAHLGPQERSFLSEKGNLERQILRRGQSAEGRRVDWSA